MRYIKSYIHYEVSGYKLMCPVCNHKAKSDKALVDHILHGNWKDQKHKEFANWLRKKTQNNFAEKAIHVCPVCKDKFLRTLATHFNNSKDKSHMCYLNDKVKQIIRLFKSGKSPLDIEKEIFMNYKWIWRIIQNKIRKSEAKRISKEIHARKRKEHWASLSIEERNQKMAPVREAEWAHLTKEERKKHPWVKAGRRASLESIKKGSKSQRYAFELLNQKLSEFNWKYNFIIDGQWQIDIASPSKNAYIEWDGKAHRKAMFGIKHLQNVQNRDKLKNRIVTEQLKGTMIRIEDNGRFNPKFVEEKVDEIVVLINQKLEKKVYQI